MNFAAVWLARVIALLFVNADAPWLDGINEITEEPIVLGEGTATEKNIIYLPSSTFKPEVLINNTTYPMLVQAFEDDQVIISLDKFQTRPTSVSDDEVLGSSYDKIDAVTSSHRLAIQESKYSKAIHALAPKENEVKTPVINCTGAPLSGTTRKTLTYNDIVTLAQKMDVAGTPAMGRRLVLCSEHWADLLRDRENFGDKLVNYQTGQVLEIAGFTCYKYLDNPYYDELGVEKLAYGVVPDEGQYRASVAFVVSNVAKKTGKTKQYYRPASADPETQTNLMNYRHYFVVLPKLDEQCGALTSTDAA